MTTLPDLPTVAETRPLPHGQLIDITTTGRRTGTLRRIEIVLHNFDGRLYIAGMPNPDRKRAWLLNLEADPRLTIHLKASTIADLPAVARVITDDRERREVFARVARVWRGQDVETMTRHSPLIEVSLTDWA